MNFLLTHSEFFITRVIPLIFLYSLLNKNLIYVPIRPLT